MQKSIKQIAKEIGISKQAVFKRIDSLGLRDKLIKVDNQFMVDEPLENELKSVFSNKNLNNCDNQVDDNLTPNINQALMEILKENLEVLKTQNEMLSQQLKIKDDQINSLQNALDQEQKFHYLTKQNTQFLEQKLDSESKQSFWDKIRGKRKSELKNTNKDF